MIVYLKTKEEIERFIKAGKIAAQIMSKLISEIKVGTTTSQLDLLARNECEKHNVKPTFLGYEGFPAAICASVDYELVHGVPNDKELLENSLVSIDLGVTLDGCIGDTAVTMLASKENSDIVDICSIALSNAIEAARPGNKLSDIAKAVSSTVKKTKYNIPLHYGGHGVNIEHLHGDPFVANTMDDIDPDEDITLRPGMVFAIEPMLVDGDPTTSVSADKWTVIVGGPSAHCEQRKRPWP